MSPDSPAADVLVPREHFPALDEVTYLNTASIGLVPMPVYEATEAFARDISRNGTVGFDEEAETRVAVEPREHLARLFSVAPDDLALPLNVTDAINQIAWWLRPGAGQNVVSAAVDFPSSTYPWLRIAQETGVEVRLAEAADPQAPITAEDVVARIDERTAAVTVSWVQYSDGTVVDPAPIAAAAKEAGALFVLDVSQGAGVIPLEIGAIGADAVVGASYKWLGGGTGSAYCWLAPDLRERLNPPFAGWRANEEPFALDATRIALAAAARKMEFSTPNYPSLMMLGEGARYLDGIGIERVQAHVAGLVAAARQGFADRGAVVRTPAAAVPSGIVSAAFPGRAPEDVARELNAAGFVCGCRVGGVRFGFHAYNSGDDVTRLLAELDRILA